MSNYWVVGAMWGGQKDQSEKLIRRGYWFLGWSMMNNQDKRSCVIKCVLATALLLKECSDGDRKHCNSGTWRHQGDRQERQARVCGLVCKGLERESTEQGSLQIIHGPFADDDPWVKEVFHI